MKKILLVIAILFSTKSFSIEFNGKFIQGHFVLGKTDIGSKIIIDKKEIKVSKDGFFVFGIDRDRKFDVLITTSYFLSLSIPKAKKPSLETLIFFLSIITFELGSVFPIIKCP